MFSKIAALLASAAAVTALGLAALTPAAAQPPAAAPAVEPLIKDAHWHHLHLNSTDPAAAIDFYTKHFNAKKARFAGRTDAVWTQRSWLLFLRAATPPTHKLNTPIWHFGWGAEDAKAEFARQQALGAKFFAPLTDISDMVGAPANSGRFYYMYVEGPDRALIELNTANHHRFGHLHMFSADPIATGDWYIKTFGVRGALSNAQTSRAPRMYRDVQIGPSKTVNFDNVNMIIYPVEYAKTQYAADWVGVSELQTTRGSVNDHIGVSVPNLDLAVAKLKDAGVKVTSEPRALGDIRFAFIEGPDKMAIELIEDRTEHPPFEE